MIHPLTLGFHDQARACNALGAPFMARLMEGLAADWDQVAWLRGAADRLTGDLGPRGLSVPLRLAGGLHALVLGGKDAALARVWPPQEGAGLRTQVRAALKRQQDFLADWITQAPQTNETGRSAVLIAAASEVVARHGLPLMISELGASAGLNLMFDRFGLQIGASVWGDAASDLRLCPEWSGPLPPNVALRVQARAGVDLNPLDPARDGRRMLAYVWPDQPARMARLQAALRHAGAAVDAGDAADWLDARLRMSHPGACHLVYHTIAHQYFPGATQAQIRISMEAAGTRATRDAPLAWLGMEADDNPDGAGITLRLWPGDLRRTLGRAGFHGQWIRWRGMGAGG